MNGSQSETSQIVRISPNMCMVQVKTFWWFQHTKKNASENRKNWSFYVALLGMVQSG